MPDEKSVGDKPRRYGFPFLSFVASGFTPDDNVAGKPRRYEFKIETSGMVWRRGSTPTSGMKPDATFFVRLVASGFMPDALDETVADKPRRYGFPSPSFVASGFMPDEEKASGINPDATDFRLI